MGVYVSRRYIAAEKVASHSLVECYNVSIIPNKPNSNKSLSHTELEIKSQPAIAMPFATSIVVEEPLNISMTYL